MDKKLEAARFVKHINENVKKFKAESRCDGSVLITFHGETWQGADTPFSVELEPSNSNHTFVYSFSALFNDAKFFYHEEPLAYLQFELSKYNIALNKRLSK